MKIFGQIICTVVNTVALPVAVFKDVIAVAEGDHMSYTVEAIEKLKKEAKEEEK